MKTVTLPIEEYNELKDKESFIISKHADKEKELNELSQSLESIRCELTECAAGKIVVALSEFSHQDAFELESLVDQIKNPEARTIYDGMLKSVEAKDLEISRLKSNSQLLRLSLIRVKGVVTTLAILLATSIFYMWVF